MLYWFVMLNCWSK